MTAPELEARIIEWVGAQTDVAALVQIGSRVQKGGVVDAWSDWDYQLIVKDPARYRNREWPLQIAPCWSAHFERTERGVTKLSVVFAGGWEVDFVLLSAWQIKLVCWAMRHPEMRGIFPPMLQRGIHNFRLVVAPGYRVVTGGEAWEKRYAAVSADWPATEFSAEDFQHHVTAFWRHAVWVSKKILRGELRAAARWSQVELREHTYALLAEEARLEGRSPRPEARQAERWLVGERLTQTARLVGSDRASLAAALLDEMTLFQEVSLNVAKRRGWSLPDHAELEAWLRAELAKVAR